MGGAQSNFPLLSHSSSQHVSTRIVERRSPNSRIGRKRTVQKARHDSRFTFTPSTPKTEATSACVTPRDDIVSTLSPFEHNLNNTFQVTDITKHLELEGCRSEGSVWIGWEVEVTGLGIGYIQDFLGIYQDRWLYLIQMRDGRKFVLPVAFSPDSINTANPLQEKGRTDSLPAQNAVVVTKMLQRLF